MVSSTKSLLKTVVVNLAGILLSTLFCYFTLTYTLHMYLASNIMLTAMTMCAMSIPVWYYAYHSISASRLQNSLLSIHSMLSVGIHFLMLGAPLIILSPLASQQPLFILCASIPLSVYHWYNITKNFTTALVRKKILQAFNATHHKPLTISDKSLTPVELLQKPKASFTLKRTASHIVLDKAKVLRTQLPTLFCQLHTINNKIPCATKALDNPKLLKSVASKTSLYVDAHRYLLYKSLIPDHFFISNTSTSATLKSKLSTVKDIDTTLQNLLSIYNFIKIHQHYRRQQVRGDIKENLLPSFNATINNVLAKSHTLTPPSPNMIKRYSCSDQTASIQDHLTFVIELDNEKTKENKLLHVSEHEFLELLTPHARKSTTDMEDLFVFNHWSSIDHLCDQHWPGTMVSFFDIYWGMKSIHVKPQRSIDKREDPQEESIIRIASQTQNTLKSPGK